MPFLARALLCSVLLTSAASLSVEAEADWHWPWSKRKAPEPKPEAKAIETEAAPATTAAPVQDDVKDPVEPGCYMRMATGCVNKNMKTRLWRHDTWAEQQNLDKAGCESRASVWNGYCESQDAKMIFVPKQASSPASSPPLSALQIGTEWHWPWSKKRKEVQAKAIEAETTQAPAAAAEDTPLRNPSKPGCYMRMPSGCPKKPMRTQLWRHDTWAEQHELDEAACQQRASVWNGFCETQDAKMVFVAKQ